MEPNSIQKNYYYELFADYPDVVNPKQLKKMLGNTIGTNKIYKLLQTKEIYNKKVGNIYIIPKISVIEYLMKV